MGVCGLPSLDLAESRPGGIEVTRAFAGNCSKTRNIKSEDRRTSADKIHRKEYSWTTVPEEGCCQHAY